MNKKDPNKFNLWTLTFKNRKVFLLGDKILFFILIKDLKLDYAERLGNCFHIYIFYVVVS